MKLSSSEAAVVPVIRSFAAVPPAGATDFPSPSRATSLSRISVRHRRNPAVPQPALSDDRHAEARRLGDRSQRRVDRSWHRRHGTAFLSQTFGGELFGAGQPLDATRYFIILPDGIGHGKSSKPSDGLHARFPKYNYDDMVRAQYALLVDGLKVNHLRLVLGTSMGAMHCWIWGEMYPDFVDGLVPLASAPTQIAGRNRMMRR